MTKAVIAFALVGFFIWSNFAFAQMSSTNYRIRWDSISVGGSDSASSTSYLLRDTTESTTAGSSTSTSYQLEQGYRAGVDDQIITFEVFSQTTSSGRSATALSGNTVTASTSGISVNDLIALVQDVGASQVAAIGRVSSIGSGTITVDTWMNGGTAPVIDGSNDSVYPLTSTSVSFGTLAMTSLATSLIGFEVSSANDNGYVVQISEDGNLRTTSNAIDDVADGSVSVGVEEYGARSSDTSLASSTFDTADTAFTTSFQDVATTSSASFESRNFVTLKVGISTLTSGGSYSQTISLIASGNF